MSYIYVKVLGDDDNVYSKVKDDELPDRFVWVLEKTPSEEDVK